MALETAGLCPLSPYEDSVPPPELVPSVIGRVSMVTGILHPFFMSVTSNFLSSRCSVGCAERDNDMLLASAD